MSSLLETMRERTAALHADAESSGIVAALLAGTANRTQYALYLRNLLPAYQAMETALQQGCGRLGLRALAQPEIYRTETIVADLILLAGVDWDVALPLLASGARYAARIELAGSGPRLIAHCYARYLGDLSGGQIMRRRLTRLFGTGQPGLTFNTFAAIADIRAFVKTYRAHLDRAGEALDDFGPVVEEAAIAFRLNIELSQEVAQFGLCRPPEQNDPSQDV